MTQGGHYVHIEHRPGLDPSSVSRGPNGAPQGCVEVPRINQTQAQNGNITMATVNMTTVLRNALPRHTKTGINLNKKPKSLQYHAVQYLTELNKCELQSAHRFYKGVAGRKMQSASSSNCHSRTRN